MAAAFALHDTLQMVVSIAYGIWRKRWYALISASLISAVGWAYVYSIPSTFEATARVQIKADLLLDNLTGIVARNNVQSQRNEANYIRTRITERPILEKIIRRSNYLDRLAVSDLELSRQVAEMRRDISIYPSGEDIFTITYQNDDDRLTSPQRAEVVKVVVDNLISAVAMEGRQTEDVSSARSVIEREITRLREELESQDDKVSAFQLKHREILRGTSIDDRLEEKIEIVSETQDELAELEAGIEETRKALLNIAPTIVKPTSANGRSGEEDEFTERLEKLRSSLDKLFVNGYSDIHPDVKNLVRQISVLEKQQATAAKEKEETLRASAGAGRVLKSNEVPNPVYEELYSAMLMDMKKRKRLQKRLEQNSSDLNSLRDKAQLAPGIKSEFERLRDSSRAAERKLTELEGELQDLSVIETSTEIDSLSFRTVEDPVKPLYPSGPNRLLYLTVPLIGGLIAGIAVAFILSQIKPVIISVEQLKHNFDMPVLGNVTRVLSERDSKARMVDLLTFGGVSGGLIFLYFVLIILNMFSV